MKKFCRITQPSHIGPIDSCGIFYRISRESSNPPAKLKKLLHNIIFQKTALIWYLLTRVDQMHRMCRLYRAALYSIFGGCKARQGAGRSLPGIFFDPRPRCKTSDHCTLSWNGEDQIGRLGGAEQFGMFNSVILMGRCQKMSIYSQTHPLAWP